MLLALFTTVRRTGVLDTSAGRWVLDRAYEGYKRVIEARNVEQLGRYVIPGTVVVDVGANIGFFTDRFARWVGPGGRVLAIEPEAVNFTRLQRRIMSGGFPDRVELVRAAACDRTETVLLNINPDHPGDHRLSNRGVPVRGLTLDELIADHGWRTVSLIKIDVQGAEMRVLTGARELLNRFRPALFVEIDDAALRAYTSSAAALIELLTALGYKPHRLHRNATAQSIEPSALLQLVAEPGSGSV